MTDLASKALEPNAPVHIDVLLPALSHAASSVGSQDRPILPAPCFHLRDRNTYQTVHLGPHVYNACYARLRLRRRWLSPDTRVEPTRVSKAHQTRYCFADYTRCPFFLPAGVPPAVLDEYEVERYGRIAEEKTNP